MTRLLLDLIDWEYPETWEPWRPTVWDLSKEDSLMKLVLALGNGIILELRAEGESLAALDALRGLVRSAGSCDRIEGTPELKAKWWFYHEGDECYQQGAKNPAYIFINPEAQPQKFAGVPRE